MKRIFILLASVLCLLLIAGGVYTYVCEYVYYDVEFTLDDTLPDGNGKRATVILLGGQSNASGCARDEYLERRTSPEKYAEYQAGYDNVYINYYCTGTNVSQGFVRCAAKQGEGGGFFGPELGLAEKLHETYPDEQFFIIKYAIGGSNLHDQWLSPSSLGLTGEMYKAFVCFVEESMEYLIGKNYDVKIAGMCWMQGESDSIVPEDGVAYEKHLTAFIDDIRDRFASYAADGGIAFVDALIANNPEYWIYCDLVNASKRAVADASPLNALVDTIEAGLVCNAEPEGEPDMAHYDSLSAIKLGHLFAEELALFLE